MTDVDIDGHSYRFEKVGSKRGKSLLLIFLRTIAPSLSMLGESLGAAIPTKNVASLKGLDVASLNLDFAKIGEALGSAVEKLSDADIDTVEEIISLRCSVREEGKTHFVPLANAEARELHFDRAGLLTYVTWLRHGVAENLSDFFPKRQPAAKKKESGDDSQEEASP